MWYFDKAGKLRKSLFQIPGIKRRYIQPVGFGIASEQPPFAIYQPSPARRHDPQVELVSIRQTLIATVLRHLQLIESPRKEAGNQHHPATKKESAPPDDAPIFLLFFLPAHDESLILLKARFIVERIT